MPIKWKYRMWCEDEQTMVTVWADANTTPLCPNNPSHTIDANKISSIQTNENYLGQKNFLVKTYQGQKLVKDTWYETDNGDDTYSQKVEETIYTYVQNKLTTVEVTTFWQDESLIKTETTEYYTDGDKVIVKKQ